MTTLKKLRDCISEAIDKHGEDSACFYSFWTVEDFQQEKKLVHEHNLDSYACGDIPHPGEFKPYTDEQMISIAAQMMKTYSATKEFIAYYESDRP